MSGKKISVTCEVNGEEKKLEVFPMERLLDVLRSECKLTGAKEGCGEGECGACSVLIDGQLVNSCLVPVIQVQGKNIRTIEGIANDDTLHPVQKAFLQCGGAQCGICTPGMIIAAVNLLENDPHPSREKVIEWLGGNLCRCTGYMKIVESILQAAEEKS
jgi:carbon-monoxide dehydrogenase small subunit